MLVIVNMARFHLVVPWLVLGVDAAAAFSAAMTIAASVSTGSVPRIPAAAFDPNLQYYKVAHNNSGGDENNVVCYETPVIVEGVLSEEECERLTDDLIEGCGQIEVTLQRKRRVLERETVITKQTAKKKKKQHKAGSKRDRRRRNKNKNKNSDHEDEATTLEGDGTIDASNPTTSTDMYLCSFLEAIDLVLSQSKHDDSLLAFCEGLLHTESSTNGDDNNKHVTSSLQKQMEDVRERLFQQRLSTRKKNSDNESSSSSSHYEPTIDPCWFQTYFPVEARPTDCVILAGEGATSTLHRDPLEWTGTNLCLDGTKVWRFFAPPIAAAAAAAETETPTRILRNTNSNNNANDGCSAVDEIDELLEAYRLDSIAWGDNDDGDGDDQNDVPLILSAGWQSDYSLFSRFRDGLSSDDLSQIEQKEGTHYKISIMSEIAADLDRLQPDIPLDILVRGDSTPSPTINTDGDRAGGDPFERTPGSQPITIWSGIQKPGDMIVIPAHWWHQTYAMEASLAIASQRCGAERDIRRVVRHIVEKTIVGGGDDDRAQPLTGTRQAPSEFLESLEAALSASLSTSPPPCTQQQTVDRLFGYLATIREERQTLDA